ncbi:MAG: hypothetical protein UW68_C0006G0009 [Candidatus Collierbacteria bacterium GW2011_GWB1_44_6]|uniref:Uncharacterized protein n=2 Tax=Candidatus Collieribacteriota TaxID=1752725 RepID=A0A0G1LXL5_9BACT|nr:MAG: hypothetical protein UV68_C0020G0011 [Candidatus Collierbacteria bacterium GW2011_GWC2_43_12]KKT73567.1 MAG: hypothetical protein UW68_C0006G0009 [Candidatus Collierbacteria bacterium GW2011_GWB1_44_6]KKT83022.1 MAG: hypothetical protein UW80_C0024G0013 [Microgenomates group bacterium GW2011_GWC1_44_9]
MPVSIVKPISTRVQEYINAWLAVNKKELALVNTSGDIITTTLTDFPAIGVTTKTHSVEAPWGYPVSHASDADDTAKYLPDAVLYLEFKLEDLPSELQAIETKFWLFEIEGEELLATITSLSEALFDEFGVDIIIRPTKVHDADPTHLEPRPLNPDYPTVLQYCPIIPNKEV